MNWKKSWKKELDSLVPELSNSVVSAPKERIKNKSKHQNRFYRLTFSAVSMVAVLVLTLVATFFFMQPPTNTETVFAVEINPAVAFVIDEKDVVKSVTAINADADVILSTKENIDNMVGKPMNEAVNYFVDCALKYGYIDLSISGINEAVAVRISSCSNKDFELLRASVEDFLCGKGKLSAVFTKTATQSEFYDIIGFANENGDSLEKMLKNAPTLYKERSVKDKDISEISSVFTEYLNAIIGNLEQAERDILQAYIESGLVDFEDYVQKLNYVLAIEQNFKERDNYVQYYFPRQEVGKDRLQHEHDKIKGENGSFEDFWNNKRK